MIDRIRLLTIAIACGLVVSAVRLSSAEPPEASASAEVEPGETITNSIGMKLTLIPAGEFQMGTAHDLGDETPHRVRITRPFYLGVYEVTQQEYEKVMESNPSHFSPTGGGRQAVAGRDVSRFPVDSVTWENATEFCRKLSGKEGKKYRLPTEAEWEYACRAGTVSAYHFGDSLFPAKAQISQQELGDSKSPATVGSYRPNRFGLHDMHGNVWEWCSDWYGKDYYTESPVDDPQGPDFGPYHVDRGGCWVSFDDVCRSANRRSTAANRSDILGFRVVLVPGDKKEEGKTEDSESVDDEGAFDFLDE